ncbi:rCG24042 [Rattus norvegicus]|uniref:RCG24042 n=1 Tax=Rattus norvegicus TaxID=10116 RepID=A6JVQ5_RAT|nr:rCG24042 [Rattus norvegicus]
MTLADTRTSRALNSMDWNVNCDRTIP